jgi:hypothetical protein
LARNGKFGNRSNAIVKASQDRCAKTGTTLHQPKEVEMFTNRMFRLMIVLALGLVFALTIQEAIATSTVAKQGKESQLSERSLAADTARWMALGQIEAKKQAIEALDRQRGIEADSARWAALAEMEAKNLALEALNSQRALAADAARWMAQAEFEANKLASEPQINQRALDASTARWVAVSEYYLNLQAANR